MPRPPHNHPLNTAGLEADVMRFMAIIAFCLIAIMALVKKIEPTAVGNEVEAKFALPVIEIEAITASPVVEVEISPEPGALKKPASIPGPVEKSSELERIAIPSLVERSETSLRRAPPRTIDRDDRQNAEPRPLIFRFDSDRTFLHLIATNNLLLYASTANGFLAMDSGFNVVRSKPAGELYEVMPKSIPRKITKIFEKNSTAPVYLVALPETTRRDLDKFLDSSSWQSTGALVIHRDGHISHET